MKMNVINPLGVEQHRALFYGGDTKYSALEAGGDFTALAFLLEGRSD